VLRKVFNASKAAVPPVDPFLLLPKSSTTNRITRTGSSSSSSSSKEGVEGVAPVVRNGFVFGSGEWVGDIALDSPQALQSIDNAVEVAGANALEFLVTWYYSSMQDTEFFPSTNASSPTRTATDAELTTAMCYAKKRHQLTVAFTPFLDPLCRDYAFCGKQSYEYVTLDNVWRADVGTGFNTTQWEAFFDPSIEHSYASYILRYARLAQASGCVDEFFVSHELGVPEIHAPAEHWNRLVKAVRAIFSGRVSAAVDWGPYLTSAPLVTPTWLALLDYVGIDCYFTGAASDPNLLPWQNPSLAKLQAAWHAPNPGVGNKSPGMSWLQALGNFSQALGRNKPSGLMDIVCTEVGYQRKPQSWVSPSGTGVPDAASCEVTSLCANSEAQGLAYETLFSVLYPLPFFKGFFSPSSSSSWFCIQERNMLKTLLRYDVVRSVHVVVARRSRHRGHERYSIRAPSKLNVFGWPVHSLFTHSLHISILKGNIYICPNCAR
jgi:hypothetical protein